MTAGEAAASDTTPLREQLAAAQTVANSLAERMNVLGQRRDVCAARIRHARALYDALGEFRRQEGARLARHPNALPDLDEDRRRAALAETARQEAAIDEETIVQLEAEIVRLTPGYLDAADRLHESVGAVVLEVGQELQARRRHLEGELQYTLFAMQFLIASCNASQEICRSSDGTVIPSLLRRRRQTFTAVALANLGLLGECCDVKVSEFMSLARRRARPWRDFVQALEVDAFTTVEEVQP
jgi:hypothetical protein